MQKHDATDGNGEVITFFRKVGIVCGGIAALWMVLSSGSSWAWQMATAPMVNQQATLARSLDSLTVRIARLERAVDQFQRSDPAPRRRS